nr:hypothetical protein [Nanoarchaeum sp.]
MKIIDELNEKSLGFYLELLRVETSALPVIGVKQVESIQFKEIRTHYFILTQDTFARINVDNPDVGHFIKNVLGSERPNFYTGYSPNHYPEVLEIHRYRSLKSEERESLDAILAR